MLAREPSQPYEQFVPYVRERDNLNNLLGSFDSLGNPTFKNHKEAFYYEARRRHGHNVGKTKNEVEDEKFREITKRIENSKVKNLTK